MSNSLAECRWDNTTAIADVDILRVGSESDGDEVQFVDPVAVAPVAPVYQQRSAALCAMMRTESQLVTMERQAIAVAANTAKLCDLRGSQM